MNLNKLKKLNSAMKSFIQQKKEVNKHKQTKKIK